MIKVSVHESKSFDPAVISRLLDDDPLPTRHDDDVPMAPFLTLDGRVHRPTSDFLREERRRPGETGTARRYASDLKGWLDCPVQRPRLPPRETTGTRCSSPANRTSLLTGAGDSTDPTSTA